MRRDPPRQQRPICDDVCPPHRSAFPNCYSWHVYFWAMSTENGTRCCRWRTGYHYAHGPSQQQTQFGGVWVTSEWSGRRSPMPPRNWTKKQRVRGASRTVSTSRSRTLRYVPRSSNLLACKYLRMNCPIIVTHLCVHSANCVVHLRRLQLAVLLHIAEQGRNSLRMLLQIIRHSVSVCRGRAVVRMADEDSE